MKNWKTTLGGIIALVGALLTQSGDPKLIAVGQILAGIGALLTGYFAADHGQPKLPEAK